MFQVGAATAGVGDDGVELFRGKLIDIPAGELLGEFPFAVVGVQGAATGLVRWGDDFTAVAGKDLDSILIDIAEGEVLRATSKHGDAEFSLTDCWRDRGDEVG